jgi:Activator of Hsp90 ATPase homolog 1-like protein
VAESDPDGGRAGVTALRRSPVRQSVLVRADLAHTFRSFVTTIGTWWPVQPFSAGKERVRGITIEQKPHGRIYETWDDGTEIDWGTVTDWRPPERFTMTWTFTPADTEVEFTFSALGPRLTKAAVEHRGWEALSDEQIAEDCALPDGYSSGAYSAGWSIILARMTESIGEGDA